MSVQQAVSVQVAQDTLGLQDVSERSLRNSAGFRPGVQGAVSPFGSVTSIVKPCGPSAKPRVELNREGSARGQFNQFNEASLELCQKLSQLHWHHTLKRVTSFLFQCTFW